VASHTLLLDACVMINLAATDRLADIAASRDTSFLLTQQVAGEVGYLRDIVGGELVTTAIELSQHAGAGTLQIVNLAPAEYPAYIELARIIDDGEASTIAVAVTRNLPLATDDRKARRVCEQRGIPEPTRTLSLVRSHTDAVGLDHAIIRDLLIKIRDRASFLPSRSDPDYKWWNDHVGDP
jgi:predicted nucleic acid-binding protein